MNRTRLNHFAAALACALAAGASPASAQPAAAEKTFASPGEAVAALRAAAETRDKAALREIFGPDSGVLLSGDPAQDEASFKRLVKAMAEGAQAVSERNGTMTLEIGRNKWPFPVPLVKESSAWRFDTATGKEAILNRRIGKDELHAIALCRAFAAGKGPFPASYQGYAFKAIAGTTALAAYPEDWGKTGIMTFIVDRDKDVLQRDLGEKTAELAPAIAAYDPAGWTTVEDPGITEK
ncbi:MAG: DUF2950 domain-containing protein [Elusimicrobia bacterium]|nr:DUF2950 domain-containing protein [Elusimicrobiota bacterium]